MAGAKGYVLKGAPDEEVADAVRSVAAGKSVISPAVARDLVQRGTGVTPAAVPSAGPPGVAPAVREPDPVRPEEAPAPSLGRPPMTLAVVLAAGLILTALGQAAAIFDGDATLGTWLEAALNFLVAYVVWRLGLLAGERRDPSR